ncbi:transmembrane protein C16orf54 isoform X2 [Alligator mississippiensis]|uniref:transmembrane protein C16orf54 isoform X2 n=1 Tax=Alligator mississippiensis TaxID=8496 RepID=UPI002877C048|nr:transmembrane protein C16orf54 isoform X2 [Alligator mississippiensis]
MVATRTKIATAWTGMAALPTTIAAMETKGRGCNPLLMMPTLARPLMQAPPPTQAPPPCAPCLLVMATLALLAAVAMVMATALLEWLLRGRGVPPPPPVWRRGGALWAELPPSPPTPLPQLCPRPAPEGCSASEEPPDAWAPPAPPLDAWAPPAPPLDAWAPPAPPLDAWAPPAPPPDAWVLPEGEQEREGQEWGPQPQVTLDDISAFFRRGGGGLGRGA